MSLAVPVADCDPARGSAAANRDVSGTADTSPNARTGCASRNWGRSVCASAQIAGAARRNLPRRGDRNCIRFRFEGLRRRGGHDPSGSTQAVLGVCRTFSLEICAQTMCFTCRRSSTPARRARPLATYPMPIQIRVAAQLRKSKTTLDIHVSSSQPALRRLRVLPERGQRREVDRPLAQLDSLALVCIAHDLLRITRVQRRDERRVCQ
ncbi:hypothetical protein FB107DRAFT_260289, partial [Schizophyllum commune]